MKDVAECDKMEWKQDAGEWDASLKSRASCLSAHPYMAIHFNISSSFCCHCKHTSRALAIDALMTRPMLTFCFATFLVYAFMQSALQWECETHAAVKTRTIQLSRKGCALSKANITEIVSKAMAIGSCSVEYTLAASVHLPSSFWLDFGSSCTC